MCAQGTTIRDIPEHKQRYYGVEISPVANFFSCSNFLYAAASVSSKNISSLAFTPRKPAITESAHFK
jgi:hypothetical protein